MNATKRTGILEAVNKLKSGTFKATAIKVEFEADIDRNEGCEGALEIFMDSLSKLTGRSWSNDIDGSWDEADAYDPIPEIAFIRCYNDGSVDTEITVTLKLDNPENIFMLPQMIQAWNEMCNACGDEMNVQGAGMHMALMNTSDYSYPGGRIDTARFGNFRKSMGLLLPALYFLGTHSEESRSLSFREPRIECNNETHGHGKFNAIHYKGGALEFRIFDTCYDKPEAILDNVVVMRNCMKYWSRTYINPGMDKVVREVNFGNDMDYRLERFYQTIEHIDLLALGLKRLKPSYLTIEELKTERNFKIDRRDILGWRKKVEDDAREEYQEYSERFDWGLVSKRYSYVASLLNQSSDHSDAAMELAEARALELVDVDKDNKITLTDFIADKVHRYVNTHGGGNFRLTA